MKAARSSKGQPNNSLNPTAREHSFHGASSYRKLNACARGGLIRSLGPMTTSDQIEFDVACLKGYFQQLFSMAEEASKTEQLVTDYNAGVESFAQHGVAAFARPDMACNIYSFVDFWLPRLCSFYERNKNLPLTYKDVRGKSQLHAYHKYLTKVVLLDLQAVSSNFDHLDSLRKVRNYLIHSGAHVENDQRNEIATIPGVRIVGSLIALSDDFIWQSLEHAKTYLCAVARA